MKIIKILFYLFLIIHIYVKNQDTYSQKTETCDSKTETCTNPNSNIEEKPRKEEKIKEEKIEPKKEEIKKEKNEEKKDEDKKEEKEEEDIKLIYADIFLKQPLPVLTNYTSKEEMSTVFDFRINDRISKYLAKNGIAPYPRERFVGKQQGNFLHFFHLVYEKKLPLFFSVDQILYPYVETTKELQRKVMEKGLYNIFHQFLTNVIEYGKKEKYEQGILLYFSIALKFLSRSEKVYRNDVCEKVVKKLLSIENNATNTIYSFTLLNSTRKIDKLNFIQIYPILKDNDNLESISDCYRFLQNFEFVLAKELYYIYKIGSLIHKSGEEKTYREIKKFIKYIFSEEENVMNPLDIYLLIDKNYKIESPTNVTINNLYNEIKDKVVRNTTLNFMSNYTFISQKEEEDFYKQRNSHVSLFSYSYTLDEFINYKLLNFQRLRFYTSYYEFADLVHHGKLMRKIIYDRYLGKNSSANGKLFKYRDGIDITDVFNYTKKTLKKSMADESDIWRDSYDNSFNYLLNIVGHVDKRFKKIEDIKIKTFNTLVGGYTHFKKDILLFEQYTNITYSKDGEIIDLYFEPNKKFYEEIQKISHIFQSHLLDLINCLNNDTIKTKLEHYVERKMKRFFISYENILKGLELQEKQVNNEERKKIKDTMFYYDKKKKKYQGWYVDLYINQTGIIDYSLNMYTHNFFMARPISKSKIDFQGIIIYTSMNYPEFGLICVEEKENEPKKLFIFSSYTGNEYPHAWVDKVNYDGLKKLIISRR